ADGSWDLVPVRVGRRQATKNTSLLTCVFLYICFVRNKIEDIDCQLISIERSFIAKHLHYF
ncbi:hypothetical protein, partial [Bacillus thuringiensis]